MIRFLPLVLLASTLAAQMPPDVVMERSGFVAWLKKGPNSPLGALIRHLVDGEPPGMGCRPSRPIDSE